MTNLPLQSITITKSLAKSALGFTASDKTEYIFLTQYFDNQKNKIKEIIMNEEGEEEQIIEFTYSKDNRILTETHHFPFDEIKEFTEFIYDNGLLTKKVKHYSYGSVENTVWTYNEYQLPLSIIVMDEDGLEEESEWFEYQGKNLTHYLKKNALIGKDTELWLSYDDKNRVMEEKRWSNTNMKTLTTRYDYSKNEEEPDMKVINEKGEIIEAHIKDFDDKNRLVRYEVQYVNNGLKYNISTFEYNDENAVVYTETIDQNENVQRKITSEYDEKGLLKSELKSEYEVELGGLNTYTLNYTYTFF
ncbi:MAG: hypothetical protein IT238_00295 [Bacteroidia bacterium]|nr:hypothetical protein [Bacteroidia bacterium]MCZ2249680.1 hypothetical protein [Bacteroidia bacterium]